jgi:phosphohistidine phosphatase
MPNNLLKTLYLFRHGKSSWDDPALTDFARPLTGRGRRAARLMGEHMAREKWKPDLVLCSSAVRARQTLEFAMRAWSAPKPEVRFQRSLYMADADALLRQARQFDDSVGSAMLVGHDPGIRDLALLLAGKAEDIYLDRIERKFPTAALAVLSFPVRRWDRIEAGSGKLTFFVRPKDLA